MFTIADERPALFFYSLLALLAAAPTAKASGEAVWDAADVAVARASPAKAPRLPKAIVKELQRRKCLIPQTFISSRTHNAIFGSFARKGAKDWAVLCSRNRVSSVLVFWGGSATKVDEILSSPDKNWLQVIGEKRIGFSRHIDAIKPGRMSEYQRREEGAETTSFDHDGIAESFLEKGSTIHYYDRGAWIKFMGAD